MKFSFVKALFLCFLPICLSAQQVDYPDWVKRKFFATEICGHNKCLAKAKAKNPSLESIIKKNNEEIAAWISQYRTLNNSVELGTTITIPVVVHLVYQNAEETLTDAAIIQMIEDMSTDFRYMNDDANNAPQAFQDVAADVEIEFCLAKRDPGGEATNGITRTLTTVQFFDPMTEAIKHSIDGGKDAWNTSEYLNIWIGELTPGLGGYATLPGTVAASEDGIVVSPEALKDPEYLGKGHRVAVHEVGHWFNLEHVFGAGPCDEVGDMVEDTPLQLLPTMGECPDEYPYLPDGDIQLAEQFEELLGFPCPYDEEGHMYSNYMDYSNPACMNMFTNGQKERMLAAVNTQRAGLLTSEGCVPPDNLPLLESSLEALLSPIGEICPGNISPKVYVRNLGQNAISQLSFDILINGQATTYDWTGNLETGEAEVIELLVNETANPGNNTIAVTISTINGGADSNTTNNQQAGSFTVYDGSYITSIQEGFEGAFPSNGWSLMSSAGDFPLTQWERSTDAAATGNASMKGNNWGSPAILFGPEYNYIYLPRIDLTAASNPVLSFDLAYKMAIFTDPDYTEFTPDFGDVMAIEISTDCGQSFEAVFERSGEQLATVFDTIVAPEGEPLPALNEHVISQGDFINTQLSLANYIGEKIIIRFLNIGYSQPIFVDNINLESSQALTANFDAMTTTICANGDVDFNYTGFGATDYEWVFEGGNPATSTEEHPIISYPQPGVYDVELTVFNGTEENTVTQTGFVTVVPQPTAVITQNNPTSSSTANDGSVQVDAFGGVPPYTYELLPDNLINTSGFFSELSAGEYSIAIYNDDTDCFVEVPFVVDVATTINNLEQRLAHINIFPNPNDGQFEIVFEKPFFEDVQLSFITVTGQELLSEVVYANMPYNETWNVPEISAGIYFLRIKMESIVSTKKIVVK